jgi:hypothetical protein
MVSALVLIPSDETAVGRVERLDALNDFPVFLGASIAAVGLQHIRVTSPHGNSLSVATCFSQDPKHGMLDQNKTVIGDPVPQILRQ